jgi:hypothetical protein
VAENNITYISIEDTGFDILNVTTKTAPIVMKSYADPGIARSLTVEGNRLYLADGANGLEVYDITDKANPLTVTTDLTPDFAESVFVNGSIIIVASDFYGVSIIRDNGGSYEVIGEYSEAKDTQAVCIHQSLIYLADGYGNFRIIGPDTNNDKLSDYAEEFFGTNPMLSDSDQDGLSDYLEVSLYRTNPLSNDTDNDSMDDYYEVQYSLNPKDASDTSNDIDSDGLNNVEEYQNNTHPRNSDTDEDFLDDGQEVNEYFTDPTNPDTDGDGWTDSWEIYYQTDPLDPLDYPNVRTTPPFSEPPPTTPWGGKPFKYYYLAIIVGGLGVIGAIVYLINRYKKRGIL